MGMGAMAGIGAWGQEINKSNSEASAKGLSPRQQHALKGTARIMGNDENYFVDMYSKLDEARKNWSKTSDYFSQLGIKDIQSLEDIKDPRELIHKVVSEIQKNKKEGKLDFKGNAKLIDDSVENLLGVNLQEALSIDVKDFNAKYKESFNNVTDAELKRMGKMGSEFTSLFETIKSFALSVTSNLAPALQKLFNAVKEGLADFKNSDTFKRIMDSMRNFFDSASGKASGAIKSLFDNLPNLVKRMVLLFDRMIITFLDIREAITYLPYTDTSQRENIQLERKAREQDLLKKERTLNYDDVKAEIEKTKALTYTNITRIAKDSELQKLVTEKYGRDFTNRIIQAFREANVNVVVQVNNTQNAEAQINTTASAQLNKGLQIGAR